MVDESGDLAASVQAELDDVTGDAASMRRLLDGRNIPPSLRAGVWKVLMGVKTKPDALSPQNIQVPDHDCPLKADSRAQAERFAAPNDVGTMAQEMAEVLTAFCRARGVEYAESSGYAEQLAPFAALSLSPADMYNCFYSLMSKFALKSVEPDSAAFDVFRLLLMYHDAELCSFLDTLRVSPAQYAQTWFRSLFVHTCGPGVILPLWDTYLKAGDPFFVFYLGLVMLINARDYVFSLADDVDGLVRVLSTMPRELAVGDIPDMCELSFHYANVTPEAVRSTYLAELFGFGTRRKTQVSVDPFSSLCIQVPAENLVRPASAEVRYFVVDVRPLVEYDSSHLASAWHLDGQLLMEDPRLFGEEMTRLVDALEATMQHPCFLGSGRDEDDQILHMVVSRFLQQKQNHVSVAKGGFSSLRAHINDNPSATVRLETNAGAVVAEAASHQAHDLTPGSKMGGKLSASLSSWGTALKEKTQKASKAAKESSISMSAKLKVKSAQYSAAFKGSAKTWMSPTSLFKSGADGNAPYRSGDRDALFSIDDPEDGDEGQHGAGRGGGADIDLAGAVLRKTSQGDLFVDLDTIRDQRAVLHVFQCNELKLDGYLYPSWLLLTQSHVIKLRELKASSREALVISRRPFSRLLKITAKKKHPTLLTFAFETTGSSPPSPSPPPPGGPEAAAPPEATTPTVEAAAPQFSIGDSPPPERKAEAAAETPSDKVAPPPAEGAVDDGSAAPTPVTANSPATSEPAAVDKLVERFLIPEVDAAKAAFRELIQAARS